jgi:xylulokinase
VVVPRPAEYVGVGAARQAAWAVSGAAEPPAWDLVIDSEYAVPPGDRSDVVQRYAALLVQMHGR